MRPLLPLALLVLAQPCVAEDWLYLTYPGDTPLKIGRTYLNDPADWDKLLRHNDIKSEYVLPANTRIRIPVELLKVTPAPATVSHVLGNVRVRPEGGSFRPLAVGDQLSGGESVQTGPRSGAGFRLADGSVLTQQASSRLTFGRLAAYGKTGMVATELALEGGRIEAAASRQLGPAGGFKVRTPVAVAGLRGTDFRLNLSDDGRVLRNEVLGGAVAVAAAGSEVVVAAAQGTVTEQGKPPEPPRPLLPAPATTGLPARLTGPPLSFAWPAMANAAGWRAQLAADPGFHQILLDDASATPRASWHDALPDGQYFLRIRAVDAAGLEGLNSDHPFELDARPLPPEPLAPADGERAYQNQVSFTWAAAPEAHGYLLQSAPAADFPADRTRVRRLDAVLGHTEALDVGRHYWRIASLDERGEPRGWSPTRAIRVQPLPSPPNATTQTAGGRAGFRWAPAVGAAGYALEIAREDGFARPEVRLQMAETEAAVPLRPGRYQWRLRAVEADGRAGDWSRPGTLVMPPEAPGQTRVVWTESVLKIHWQGHAPAFRVEVARDPGFRDILFSRRETGRDIRLPAQPPGQYWTRVIALDDAGGESAPGPATGFTVIELH
jgi:hypothetical protein